MDFALDPFNPLNGLRVAFVYGTNIYGVLSDDINNYDNNSSEKVGEIPFGDSAFNTHLTHTTFRTNGKCEKCRDPCAVKKSHPRDRLANPTSSPFHLYDAKEKTD